MDSEQMSKEDVLFALAEKLMANNKMEADAVKGYTEQLCLIQKAKTVCADDPDMLALLERLEADTTEKTQDELSHGNDLYKEYTELTGIVPKED